MELRSAEMVSEDMSEEGRVPDLGRRGGRRRHEDYVRNREEPKNT